MRRKSFDDISFGSVSALAMCCVCNFRAVKMFHLSAISRQDVPSFGGGSCVCVCCVFNFRAVKIDVPSFGSFSSRCSIFRQGKLCMCVLRVLCVQLSCCQDVPSFGGGSWMVLCVANLSEAAVLFSVY